MDIQLSIFGAGPPSFDSSFGQAMRQRLDDACWVEHVPGWLAGSDALFDAMVDTMSWRAERREMYDRVVDVPRLTARPPTDGAAPPIIDEMSGSLGARYGEALGSVGLAYYRSGADSVAMHGDRLGSRVSNAVIAIVSLGAPRRFLLRPKAGGPSIGWPLGGGDLLVMGGACQRDWLHGVPKVAHAGPRISIQFRPSGCWRRVSAPDLGSSSDGVTGQCEASHTAAR